MVKVRERKKEGVVNYIEEYATLLNDLNPINTEYIESLKNLVSAINKKSSYKRLDVKMLTYLNHY